MPRAQSIRKEFIRIMREDGHAQVVVVRNLGFALLAPIALIPLLAWLTGSLWLGLLGYLAGATTGFAYFYAFGDLHENIAKYPGFVTFCSFLSKTEIKELFEFLEQRAGGGVARYDDVLEFIGRLPDEQH
ncbi:MAG: hypothetical protein AB1400_10065 [Pseudomonadota bacterium]|jgi:hypothetical protein